MTGSEPSLADAIHDVATDVAECLRCGESRASVRASLIAGGLPAEVVDGLLAGVANARTWRIRSALASALTAILLMVLPVAGGVGGVCGTWVPLTGETGIRCGTWIFPALFVAALGGLIGLMVGVWLALVASAVLSEWSVGGADTTE